jgi:mono/diheme cytochrome c family protein
MRLRKGLKRYGLVAIAVPGLLLLTAIATLADASPSPSGSPSAAALPGDPTKGQAVYQANCTTCHGSSLEGNIGPALNPIAHLPGVTNPLDPTYLIDTITNGLTPSSGPVMPAWKGKLSDQDIKDAASFIIQQNQLGGENVPLAPGELAKRTIFWVGVGIIAMVFVTYLLAQYNMRWIARRAAARRR